MYMQNRQLMHC